MYIEKKHDELHFAKQFYRVQDGLEIIITTDLESTNMDGKFLSKLMDVIR